MKARVENGSNNKELNATSKEGLKFQKNTNKLQVFEIFYFNKHSWRSKD